MIMLESYSAVSEIETECFLSFRSWSTVRSLWRQLKSAQLTDDWPSTQATFATTFSPQNSYKSSAGERKSRQGALPIPLL